MNFRTCILIGPAHPLRGGIADFNEALARALHAEGIQTTILSFSLQYPSFLFPGKTQKTDAPAPLDLDIHPLINSINPLSWFRAAAFIRVQKPDFIVIRYWLPFMSPALSTIARKARKAGIKVIAITDNVIPHEKRIGDTFLTRYFVESCDAFMAMSQTVVEDLKKLTSSKQIVFSPHPVYDIFGEKISKADARKKLGLNASERILLFFGFIRHYKGLDLLLEAMTDEKVRPLNLKLVVAGEFYGDEENYKKLISDLNLKDQVILRSSFIPKEEVKNYFCAADLVVQTYRSATQSGITQIAYHFERPMLVTNVGGLAEIVPDGKVGYVTEVDAKEIAGRIADFYLQGREEEFMRNTVHEKGRFTWKGFVNQLISLVQ